MEKAPVSLRTIERGASARKKKGDTATMRKVKKVRIHLGSRPKGAHPISVTEGERSQGKIEAGDPPGKERSYIFRNVYSSRKKGEILEAKLCHPFRHMRKRKGPANSEERGRKSPVK